MHASGAHSLGVTIPQSAYRNRAANRKKPLLHNLAVRRHFTAQHLVEHTQDEAFALATDLAAPATYRADWSEFQPVVTDAYAYATAEFRCFSGYRVDTKAKANWDILNAWLNIGRMRVVFTYPVFVPGQFNLMVSTMTNLFGKQSPTNRLVGVLDVESGTDFAGPGNHSAEANDWSAWLAAYTHTPVHFERGHGYANNPDYRECWPQILPVIPKHTAAYNAVNPGTFSWQYQGGNPAYPAPTGAPRSFAPFGTFVDGNVIYESLDTIEQLLGIANPPPAGEDSDMTERIIALGNEFYRYSFTNYMTHVGTKDTAGTNQELALIFSTAECITKNTNLYGNSADALANQGIEVCDQAHFNYYNATIQSVTIDLEPADLDAIAESAATAVVAALPKPPTKVTFPSSTGTLS